MALRSRAKNMLLVLVLAALAWSGVSPAGPRLSEPGRYEGYSEPVYHGMVTRSVYVPMRDGVRLALDYSLPRGLPASEKIPALLIQTRYWRARAIKAMNDETDDRYFTGRGQSACL